MDQGMCGYIDPSGEQRDGGGISINGMSKGMYRYTSIEQCDRVRGVCTQLMAL